MPESPPRPPRFYSRVFKWFCKNELYPELQGDLLEEFLLNVEEFGHVKARWIYRQEVLKMIRPSIVKALKKTTNSTFFGMLQINIKLAFRSLLKQKLYTAINIGGLAMSIAVSTLILLYVQSETTYDSYHPNKDRLYRLAVDRTYPDHVSQYARTPVSMAEQAAIDFPEIETYSKIFLNNGGVNVTYDNETFLENNFIAADRNFFEVFGVNLINGKRNEVFSVQNAAILSENAAVRYFGDDDPIGKILRSDLGDLIVTGVAENTPKNTHFKFDVMVDFEILDLGYLQKPNFLNFGVFNYLLLKEGVDVDVVNKKFDQLVENYAAGEIERRLRMSFADYKASGNGYNYYLQPVQDIHLNSHLEGEFQVNGNLTYIYIFSAIAVFIIILAVVNFINLATARSTERAKEVGIRKVMGSLKKQLVGQFLAESIFVTVSSTIIGLVAAYLLLPTFNNFADKTIIFQDFISLSTLVLFGLFAVLLGLFAGLYPAFFLSSFQPVAILKGRIIRGKKGQWIRNGLVVFQFLISIVLVCSTLIVGQQMKYMQNRNLGFDRENVIVLQRTAGIKDLETFKTEVKRIPGVSSIGGSSALPGSSELFFGSAFQVTGATESISLNCMVVEDEFLHTMNMNLTSGRFFSKDFEDSLSLILNESAARSLGIMNDPIGQLVMNNQDSGNPEGDKVYRVVGVVKDFNYKSLHNEITPLVIFNNERYLSGSLANLVIKADIRESSNIIRSVENLWLAQAPDQTLIYSFLDQNLSQLYATEKKSGDLFLVFTGIAILIACIGLFGLATFVIGSRVKEIAVRKVLGASTKRVLILLMHDFNRLVLIAIILSVPLVIWFMSGWLEGFAYRIQIGQTWTSFIAGGLIALAIAWVTVSYHSIKAALANPVKNLRSE